PDWHFSAAQTGSDPDFFTITIIFRGIYAWCAEEVLPQKPLNTFRPSRLIDQPMKTKTFSLIAAASLMLSGMAFGVQDYQVTGPVAEISDTMIVVEKGAKKERFELARDSSTKMSGDVKVGDKVTVHYTMTAKDVEVKAAK